MEELCVRGVAAHQDNGWALIALHLINGFVDPVHPVSLLGRME
jgi:hypothetical protein